MKVVLVGLQLALLFSLSSQNVRVTISGEFASCRGNVDDFIHLGPCVYENSTVHWGTPTVEDLQSGLVFDGILTNLNVNRSSAPIGYLTHENWPINGFSPNFVDFMLHLFIESEAGSENLTIPFTLEIDETNNGASELSPNGTCPFENDKEWFGLYNESSPCCPYYTLEEPCSDLTRFLEPINVNYTFQVNETAYTLYILGFDSSPLPQTGLTDTFITQEGLETNGTILATLVAVCSPNSSFECDDFNECTFDSCKDGFCHHNSTMLDGTPCNYEEESSEIDPECFEDLCQLGECVRMPFKCPDGGSSEPFDSSSTEGGDDDDDDFDWVPILASLLSAACLCCLLIPLLLLPLLCLFIPVAFIGKALLSSVASKGPSPDIISREAMNPLYENLEEPIENPLFDL